MKESSKFLFPAVIVSNFLSAIKPFIVLHFSAVIVEGLYRKGDGRQILLWAFEMVFCVFLTEVAGYLLGCHIEKSKQLFSCRESLKLTEKNMQMDYQAFESSRVQELLANIQKAQFQRGDLFGNLLRSVDGILSGLFGVLASLVYVREFFLEKYAAGIYLYKAAFESVVFLLLVTASIIYTSGTTGFSKGVELTHKNLVWNAQQCCTIQHVGESDRFLSILPLAHTYENTLGLLLPLMFGARVFYLDRVPTPKLLVPAMQKIKPTVILSVPLVIEKIYKTQILPKFTSNRWVSALYRLTLVRKFMNRLAGKKLMTTFGGKLLFFGIGGSKLDPTVERFLHEARFPYAIGYGLTETSPMSAGSNPSQTFLQGVGPVMEGVQVQIHNADEKGEGEIWIKGPHVMKGYYKKPELTKESITPDGWFKTGDLGSFDKKGRLSIRGRIKTMILGASGENIYPEEIESIINNFRFVNESLVVESKGKLVAMVHFNMEELEKQYKKLKNQAGTYKNLVNDYIEEQKRELREYVNSRVNNFSKLQLVLVQSEPFEKTPTQKIKRFLYQK